MFTDIIGVLFLQPRKYMRYYFALIMHAFFVYKYLPGKKFILISFKINVLNRLLTQLKVNYINTTWHIRLILCIHPQRSLIHDLSFNTLKKIVKKFARRLKIVSWKSWILLIPMIILYVHLLDQMAIIKMV